LPSINAVHREFEPRGLAVLLINIRESRETVARIATERGYVVPILLDADGRVSAEYAVQGTPTTYLVDRQGDVVARAIGPRPWTGPEGRALFRALLDAPPPRR
jgi:peroxiredoxin